MLPMGPRVVPPGRSKCLFDREDHSLLLDVGAQLEDILFAGHLELVGEVKVFHLHLWVREADGERSERWRRNTDREVTMAGGGGHIKRYGEGRDETTERELEGRGERT